MARQVIAVLVIVVVFSIFNSMSFVPESEYTRKAVAAALWHSASPYLAASFVVVAFGMALTSGAAVNIAADCIARAVSRTRTKRPKQVLVGLSVQFGLGSILMAVVALRMPCEIALILCRFSSPVYEVVWAAGLSVVVAGCGANAHAFAKASRIIPAQHRS
jgi:hypothetical protein